MFIHCVSFNIQLEAFVAVRSHQKRCILFLIYWGCWRICLSPLDGNSLVTRNTPEHTRIGTGADLSPSFATTAAPTPENAGNNNSEPKKKLDKCFDSIKRNEIVGGRRRLIILVPEGVPVGRHWLPRPVR